MTDYIAMETLRHGATEYLPGDRIDVDAFLARGEWTERLAKQLKDRKSYGELTKQGFEIAKARRPSGAPWPPRGFTEAYLETAGLVDPVKAPDPATAASPPAKRIERIELAEDKIEHGGNFIQPKKKGNFTFFDVADAEGRLLRDSSFRSLDKAKEFLDSMSTAQPPAGTSGGEAQEKPDGGDVRPESDGREGPDPATDR